MLALAFGVVLLLMRDRPSDLGLPPYGETNVLPAACAQWQPLAAPELAAQRAARRVAHRRVLGSVRHLLRLRLQHQRADPDALDLDLRRFRHRAGRRRRHTGGDRRVRPGRHDRSGWLSDRYDNRWLLFWFYGLRGLSLIYLPFTDFSIYELSLFAVFYGLDWVATVPPTVKLTAERFGPERAGMVFGWIFAGHQLGAASAAYVAGATRTELETYMPALFIAGTLCLIAAGLDPDAEVAGAAGTDAAARLIAARRYLASTSAQ